MPLSPQAVLHFKKIAAALLCVVAAALGAYAVGLFGDHFEMNPVHMPMPLTQTLAIDVLGAVTPVAVALVALAVFLKTAEASPKRFGIAFFFSVCFAFLLSHVTLDGIASYPLLYAAVTSLTCAAVNLYPKPFAELRRKLVASLLLAVACIPLSVFFVDLAYTPFFSKATIGGNGLADGLLLSTLYAPIMVIVVFAAVSYTMHVAMLIVSFHGTKEPKAQE